MSDSIETPVAVTPLFKHFPEIPRVWDEEIAYTQDCLFKEIGILLAFDKECPSLQDADNASLKKFIFDLACGYKARKRVNTLFENRVKTIKNQYTGPTDRRQLIAATKSRMSENGITHYDLYHNIFVDYHTSELPCIQYQCAWLEKIRDDEAREARERDSSDESEYENASNEAYLERLDHVMIPVPVGDSGFVIKCSDEYVGHDPFGDDGSYDMQQYEGLSFSAPCSIYSDLSGHVCRDLIIGSFVFWVIAEIEKVVEELESGEDGDEDILSDVTQDNEDYGINCTLDAIFDVLDKLKEEKKKKRSIGVSLKRKQRSEQDGEEIGESHLKKTKIM
jgi:hypothetical protein